MSKIKYQNPLYSGGIPLSVGDRYYAQDLGRDFHSSLDFMSTYMRSITNLNSQLLRGGICSKGTNFDDMNITAAFGITGFSVETPDDFSSLPPTVQSEDILALIVESIAQINFDLTTGTLDGVTVNYVKLRYKEIDGGTRNRAKKSGSYVYEKEPSFEIIVNSTAPTIYDCLLCSFTGDGSSILTITQSPPYFSYEVSTSADITVEVGNSREIKINSDTSGGNNTVTLQDGSVDGQRFEVPSDGSGLTYLKGTGLYLGVGSLGIPISDGLKCSGKWNASLSKWIPDNEVTADYASGIFIIQQKSNGRATIIELDTTNHVTSSAAGGIFFFNTPDSPLPITLTTVIGYLFDVKPLAIGDFVWMSGSSSTTAFTLRKVFGATGTQTADETTSKVEGDY